MSDFTYFTLISRPTLIFCAVRFYNAAGTIPVVYGITLDGKHSTCARIADVVAMPPAEEFAVHEWLV